MIVIIISGGSGARLWPVSRTLDPKPFLKLSDGYSLLQKTYLRALNLEGVKRIVTITNKKLHFRMQDEFQQLASQTISCDFILEPYGRNTAPAVAVATLFVEQNFPTNEPILVLPADHLINDEKQFKKAVTEAKQIAELGYITTFGITPSYPETGYGYIELDSTTPILAGFRVKKFVEKPNVELAEKYVADSSFLWNSGMFCATAQTFLNEFSSHANELLQKTRQCYIHSSFDTLENNQIIHLNDKTFQDIENISIDYAIIEKSLNTAVVPCQIGWSDIGSWMSITQTLPKDANNNAIIGETILHNTNNCLLYSTNRIIAGLNIDNLIVVDTPDAVLIAHKDQSQDVKYIFERLKKMEHKTSQSHLTEHRPWGTFTILEEGELYKIKRIEVKPGASLSLQMHHQRSEHWIVVEGTATVVNGDKQLILHSNQSTYIEKEAKHRLENQTDKNLILIEVQCGTYLGEDDIVRFEDKYGRDTTTK
ncbi:MAG: mannose-1-phosphate guanylyltransferase/mannose-6-phosphate isomerase [Bacteroidia bacterium]|nr:MAG: mannose-1-phosphate guanylyltransferase/mannose-6-phosphate isomerase [Bacteroidia bacterium]